MNRVQEFGRDVPARTPLRYLKVAELTEDDKEILRKYPEKQPG